MNSPRPTLHDVARLADVSAATASRALRGDHRVAPPTASRVRKSASQIGYVPDPLLASLAVRRFKRPAQASGLPLALILEARGEDLSFSMNQHYPTALATAEQLGFNLELHNLAAGPPLPKLLKILFHRGVAGLLLDRLHGSLALFAKVDWSPFVVVSMDRRLESPRLYRVLPSVVEPAVRAIRLLLDRGRQRIAFALFRHSPPHPDDRDRGAVVAHFRQENPDRFAGLIEIADSEIHCCTRFIPWLHQCRPDALVAFNSLVFHWLSGSGLVVPRDLEVMLLVANSKGLVADPSGMLQDRARVAREAIFLLESLYRRGLRGVPEAPFDIHIPSRFNQGTTLREIS